MTIRTAAIGRPSIILLVEDNDDHAELVRRSLEAHGVVECLQRVADGECALDYLWRRGAYTDPDTSPRPDLVLLDLRLPRLDGMEVLRQMKQSPSLHRIPVIVLTTSEAERDVTLAYDLHANSYLVKPVAFDDFDVMLQDVGRYWLVRNTRSGTST